MRGWAIVGIVLLAALAWKNDFWWGPPDFDQTDAIRVAEEEYGGKQYCHVSADDIRWPCVRVVDVKVDWADSNFEKRDQPRPCFDVEIDLETTPWNPSWGTPTEPRTFTPAQEPFHVCHEVSHVGSSSWWITDPQYDWYRPITEALWRQHCLAGPCRN